jgi:hypothetical protein
MVSAAVKNRKEKYKMSRISKTKAIIKCEGGGGMFFHIVYIRKRGEWISSRHCFDSREKAETWIEDNGYELYAE